MSAKLMSTSDAAEILGVSEAEIIKMLTAGELGRSTPIAGEDGPVVLRSAVMHVYGERRLAQRTAGTPASEPTMMMSRRAGSPRQQAIETAQQRCQAEKKPEMYGRFLAAERKRLGIETDDDETEPARTYGPVRWCGEPASALPEVADDEARHVASARAVARCQAEKKPEMYGRFLDEELATFGVMPGIGCKFFGPPVPTAPTDDNGQVRQRAVDRAVHLCQQEGDPSRYSGILREELDLAGLRLSA